MEKLRKKGHPVAPVTIEGRTIATTFWGKAWCDNLESYRDYENRLPRGRTYVRNGSVIDLQIAATRGKGDGQRVVDLQGHGQHRRRCRERSGSRSARIARAGSTPWWSCCRGGFPRA